jgi:feruloyl esterase
MMRRAVVVVLAPAIALAMTPGGGPVMAAPGGASVASENDALARCRALIGEQPPLPDTVAKVTEASVIPASATLPAFCQATATLRPQVGMQIRLPISHWNHKFFEYVRGGFCRPVSMEDCDTPLRKGYACAISDDGNQTSKPDEVWSYDDTQAKVDCGFRANHITAVASKALTTKFYGERPKLSYAMGCSTGGRMAMVEATRFPYDFDGIIAGAPPISKYENSIALAWNALAPLDKDGRQILFADDAKLLHAAVLAKCDALDGLKDGVIADPLACKFDPASIQCAAGQTTGCLTPEKVAAVRKIYGGPVNSKGEHLYNGAPLPGSELNWIRHYIPVDGQPSIIFTSMNDAFRNIAYPKHDDSWSILQLNWDTVSDDIQMAEAFYSGANPDLRHFKAHGGKLLAYHGLNDQLVMPGNYADYARTVKKTMGGAAATDDFFRLFQVPGLNHCTGGDGAGVIDYISYLETWVEQGKAPDMMIAAHLKTPDPAGILPVNPANVTFTRPVFPYPLIARYKGGDPNLASSFVAVPSMAQ